MTVAFIVTVVSSPKSRRERVAAAMAVMWTMGVVAGIGGTAEMWRPTERSTPRIPAPVPPRVIAADPAAVSRMSPMEQRRHAEELTAEAVVAESNRQSTARLAAAMSRPQASTATKMAIVIGACAAQLAFLAACISLAVAIVLFIARRPTRAMAALRTVAVSALIFAVGGALASAAMRALPPSPAGAGSPLMPIALSEPNGVPPFLFMIPVGVAGLIFLVAYRKGVSVSAEPDDNDPCATEEWRKMEAMDAGV
ncbi:MAG: hypothetical protein AAGK09_09035 [Planctomycetota bacterium]